MGPNDQCTDIQVKQMSLHCIAVKWYIQLDLPHLWPSDQRVMVKLDHNDCRAEIIKDHNALTYTLKPRDLEEAADMACKLKVSDMNAVFPDVS